jgi:transposase
MFNNKMPFLAPFPISRIEAKKLVDRTREKFECPSNRINRYEIYGIEENHVYEGLSLKAYVYYSAEKFLDEERKLYSDIEKTEEVIKKLSTGLQLPSKCKDYFDIKTSGKSETFSYVKNFEKIKKLQSYLGYFVFLSSDGFAESPEKIITIYRNRDIVEKAFDDLKNGMDFSRLRGCKEINCTS